jgi:UDP-3-O-[3-hydroxymyristoyl] glucosamine N-acyltransferase
MTSVTATLGELARLVAGRVVGDPETIITGAMPLGEVAAGQITFIDQSDRLPRLAAISAAAVVVPEGVGPCELPLIVAPAVHAAFGKIVAHFRPPRVRSRIGISPQAVISASARIGTAVDVHPGATIDDDVVLGDRSQVLMGAHVLAGCVLGCDVTIGPGVVLEENTVVGDRTRIHAGTVIGAAGFGYRQEQGRHVPAAQLGHVVIGCDVEIGANVTIDRGTYGTTRIGDGTKIDNLVQIAHNCQIGRHNLICSQVGIAGSTTTGDYVVMAGQVGVRDHVHIGTGAVLSAMAGVSNDVPAGVTMLGIPATPEREQKLKLAALAKLPEMRKEFKELRRRIVELEELLASREPQQAA